MATGKYRAPPGLTLKTIEETKGSNALGDLAGQFSPPVSTENCTTVSEKRERIKCAWMNAKGEARDLESVSEAQDQIP